MVDGIGYNPWYRANNKLISTFKAVENCDGKTAKSAFVKKLELNNESYLMLLQKQDDGTSKLDTMLRL